MCSHMLTPAERRAAVLQMSVNTVHESRVIPTGFVCLCLQRQSQHLHILCCDDNCDEDVNSTRLKEDDKDVFFFPLNCIHAYFNTVLFGCEFKSKRISLLISLKWLSVSASTEVAHQQMTIAPVQKRVNFLVYQSQPI